MALPCRFAAVVDSKASVRDFAVSADAEVVARNFAVVVVVVGPEALA